jgi:hypothetical protein
MFVGWNHNLLDSVPSWTTHDRVLINQSPYPTNTWRLTQWVSR